MGSVEANQGVFEVSEKGNGDPVILVHGSAGDHRTWHHQLEALGRHYRTIAYSRRYHWPNEPISEGGEYSLDQHVQDLLSVLEELNATPAHLVGHSYGGVVCLAAAMRMPQLFRSLVLEEPPVLSLFVSVPPRPAEVLASAFVRPRTTAGILRLGALGLGPATKAAQSRDLDGMIRLSGRAILGAEAFEALSEERVRQVRDNAIPEEFLSGSFLPRMNPEDVSKLQLPVLLVGGSRSPFVFDCLLTELARLLPRAKRVRVEDASHIAHEDNPTGFDEEVLLFFESQRTQS